MNWQVVGAFWVRLVAWALGITVFLGLMDLTSPREGSLVTGFVQWGGMALVLAAFPAGIGVSERALGATFSWKRWVAFGMVAASASLTFFLLVGWIGPAIIGQVATQDQVPYSAAMSLGELRGVLTEAVESARALGEDATRDDWYLANHLAFHYFSRIDGSALPFLLAWFGVFVGYWLRLVPHRQLRLAQAWAIGILLVMTTYLSGENAYEMIVLQSAGFAAFAADIQLIVPTVGVAALGWPTLLSLWSRPERG